MFDVTGVALGHSPPRYLRVVVAVIAVLGTIFMRQRDIGHSQPSQYDPRVFLDLLITPDEINDQPATVVANVVQLVIVYTLSAIGVLDRVRAIQHEIVK